MHIKWRLDLFHVYNLGLNSFRFGTYLSRFTWCRLDRFLCSVDMAKIYNLFLHLCKIIYINQIKPTQCVYHYLFLNFLTYIELFRTILNDLLSTLNVLKQLWNLWCLFPSWDGTGDRMHLIYYVLRRDRGTKAVIFIRLRTGSGPNRLISVLI